MSGKFLILAGCVWLVVVMLWLVFGSIAFSFPVPRGAMGMALARLFSAAYLLLLSGWIGLVGIGIYRLAKHR